MKYTTLPAVLSASALFGMPFAAVLNNPIVPIGCFKSISGFKDLGTYQYQSSGYCGEACANQTYPFIALSGGDTCSCGRSPPAMSESVDFSECNISCNGYPNDKCGGPNSLYNVWANGLDSYKGPVATATTSTGTASSTSGSPSVITEAGTTIVVTAPGQTSALTNQNGSSKSKSTAGIAAGVVVGIVALGAIGGAAYFFLRRQRRKAMEEEFHRNAALNTFIGGKKPATSSSMAESRWDGDYMAERRQSNGSIADDQDFSRRILKVTNPDR